MDCIGLMIADLVPESYRGVYAADGPDGGRARSIAQELANRGIAG